MAKLLFGTNEDDHLGLELGETNRIGRDQDSSIQLRDGGVSNHHAEVVRGADGRFRLLDLGSRNGTFVNGARVLEHRLADGDRLRFGSTQCVFVTASAQRRWVRVDTGNAFAPRQRYAGSGPAAKNRRVGESVPIHEVSPKRERKRR